MNPALKRSLWCRWFHRYRMSCPVPEAVTTVSPDGREAIRMSAGPGRSCCFACSDALTDEERFAWELRAATPAARAWFAS